MSPTDIQTAGAAFMAGLVTSLHCIGMCGPVPCALRGRRADADSPLLLTSYHLARILSYSLIGGAAGAIGSRALKSLSGELPHLLAWVTVGLFLLIALRLDRWLPKPAWANRMWGWVTTRTAVLSPLSSGGLIGFFTPLLPCGPLYLLFAACLATDSAWQGAAFAASFGAGTMPLLWLAQGQFLFWSRKISPRWLDWIQRGLALLVCLLLAQRLCFGSTMAQAAEKPSETRCPHCSSP